MLTQIIILLGMLWIGLLTLIGNIYTSAIMIIM